MPLLFLKKNYRFLLGFVVLLLYVATAEMRPGRLYFILNYLLFQVSITDFLAYAALFLLSAFSFWVLLFLKNRYLWLAFILLLAPALFVSFSYRFISGYNFMYSDATTALNNLKLLPLAFGNFKSEILLALLATVLVIGFSWFLRKKMKLRFSGVYTFLPVLATVLVLLQVKNSNGIVDDFPAIFRVPVDLAVGATNRLTQPIRQTVPVKPVQKGVPKLFLIVDESVTGGELGLNNPNLETTPFLKKHAASFINFGLASSTTNQSDGSNIALMCGTRPEELPDKNQLTLQRQNIFQFAKKAGYTTYYIDGQLTGKTLQNFVSPEDLKYIDHFWQPGDAFPDQPRYLRDHLIAEKLTELAKSEKKVFVYVVKVGAHWPYASAYPADSAFFQPVLGKRSLYKDRERTLNTYHNALRWSVDEFWKKLHVNILPQDSTLVIYTSDHGQNLREEGFNFAHASVFKASQQEAEVPLLIWDPARQLPANFKPNFPNQYSHAYIFPTLLWLQGFPQEYIRKNYGPTLADTVKPRPRYFLTGDFFGRGPTSLNRFRD
ncbi:sulfatase-like hydrolase/transferase [Adhaeribacter sp. BT258]|uniref:Sulfatase-like hydrolase/transferase n=1 Tax=Adhaeribacter terrigena TaxID=2793070 RepID=A0ABS1BXZ8_9BACT|nr:sulfatase-like hydrolase/transferase [Adhaeribacter terrigena]MBK0401939.1 sulfatase-like hydrolase/transferase [Adhaeribacter terrigena]